MPRFIDIDQTLSAEAAATARTAIAASDYVGAVRPNIAADGSTDDYAVIQAALDTGSDVVLSGPTGGTEKVTVKTSATLLLTAVGQRLITVNACLAPAFVGDAVRITTGHQHVNCEINADLQPVGGDYEEVAAIRIGLSDATENPKNASVAGSRVSGSWQGNGIIWEQGAHINFAHFSVDASCTFDGIRATPNCDDNNEGNFLSTRVSNCGRYGYWLKNNAADANKSSRGHVFSNAKAFGCNKNFLIETKNNAGFIYSENGSNPDEFTATSQANNINYVETNTMYASVSDLGTGNHISGKNSYNNWDARKLYVRTLYVNSMITGAYLTLAQTAAYVFADSIIGTNNNVTVDHNTTGAGSRTDTFQNIGVSGSLDFGTGDTTVTRTSAGQLAVEGKPVGIKVSVPASAGATGVVGQWAAESGWLYICVATNTWERVAIASW